MIRVKRVVRLAPSEVWMYVFEGVRGSLSECWTKGPRTGSAALDFAARASRGLKSETGLA